MAVDRQGRPMTAESCLRGLPQRTATVAASATRNCFSDERRWRRARLPCQRTDGARVDNPSLTLACSIC